MCLNPLFIHYFPPVWVTKRDGSLFKARDQWEWRNLCRKITRKETRFMNKQFTIGSRRVGENCPVFIVAEMSANHLQDYNRAIEIIHAAKEAERTPSSCRPIPPTPSP